jgi:outer membrane immunogenic protein
MRHAVRAALLTTAAMTISLAVQAADLPARPTYNAPAAVAPIYNWSGFYAGLNAGYGWSANSNGDQFTDFPAGSFATTFAVGQTPRSVSFSPKGFIGGFEAGYNWQTGAVVFGVEADISYASIRGSGTFSFAGSALGAPETTTASSSLNWLSTERARLGFTPGDRILVFATGGFAFGEVNNQMSIFASNPGAGFLATLNGSHKSIRTGWVAGAGAGYAITNNVIAKLEWRYYDLGTDSFSAPEVLNGAVQPFGLTSHIKTAGNIVRAGIDIKFGPDAVNR